MDPKRIIPLNEEYLAQCEVNLFQLAQQAVTLAMETLRCALHEEEEKMMAFQVIKTYADHQQIRDLPPFIKRALLVEKYEEEEVIAMEEKGRLCRICANFIPSGEQGRYPHWREADRFTCRACWYDPSLLFPEQQEAEGQ